MFFWKTEKETEEKTEEKPEENHGLNLDKQKTRQAGVCRRRLGRRSWLWSGTVSFGGTAGLSWRILILSGPALCWRPDGRSQRRFSGWLPQVRSSWSCWLDCGGSFAVGWRSFFFFSFWPPRLGMDSRDIHSLRLIHDDNVGVFHGTIFNLNIVSQFQYRIDWHGFNPSYKRIEDTYNHSIHGLSVMSSIFFVFLKIFLCFSPPILLRRGLYWLFPIRTLLFCWFFPDFSLTLWLSNLLSLTLSVWLSL